MIKKTSTTTKPEEVVVSIVEDGVQCGNQASKTFGKIAFVY